MLTRPSPRRLKSRRCALADRRRGQRAGLRALGLDRGRTLVHGRSCARGACVQHPLYALVNGGHHQPGQCSLATPVCTCLLPQRIILAHYAIADSLTTPMQVHTRCLPVLGPARICFSLSDNSARHGTTRHGGILCSIYGRHTLRLPLHTAAGAMYKYCSLYRPPQVRQARPGPACATHYPRRPGPARPGPASRPLRVSSPRARLALIYIRLQQMQQVDLDLLKPASSIPESVCRHRRRRHRRPPMLPAIGVGCDAAAASQARRRSPPLGFRRVCRAVGRQWPRLRRKCLDTDGGKRETRMHPRRVEVRSRGCDLPLTWTSRVSR